LLEEAVTTGLAGGTLAGRIPGLEAQLELETRLEPSISDKRKQGNLGFMFF